MSAYHVFGNGPPTFTRPTLIGPSQCLILVDLDYDDGVSVVFLVSFFLVCAGHDESDLMSVTFAFVATSLNHMMRDSTVLLGLFRSLRHDPALALYSACAFLKRRVSYLGISDYPVSLCFCSPHNRTPLLLVIVISEDYHGRCFVFAFARYHRVCSVFHCLRVFPMCHSFCWALEFGPLFLPWRIFPYMTIRFPIAIIGVDYKKKQAL